MKYHINPKTGQISVCKANIKDCIYGAENHRGTLEEAQIYADEINERLAKRDELNKYVNRELAAISNDKELIDTQIKEIETRLAELKSKKESLENSKSTSEKQRIKNAMGIYSEMCEEDGVKSFLLNNTSVSNCEKGTKVLNYLQEIQADTLRTGDTLDTYTRNSLSEHCRGGYFGATMVEKDEIKYIISLRNDDSLNMLEIACDKDNQKITHIKNIVSNFGATVDEKDETKYITALGNRGSL
jgi:hypothetical protein